MKNNCPQLKIIFNQFYSCQVGESSNGLNSSNFTSNVPGLEMTWNLSVRCWTCEGGVKLTNPVVICLNLVQVSLLDNSQYQGRDARLNFQFGVFNNSLNHFTVGKLEKVSFVTRKFCY